MPDKRKHRGPHPKDGELFADDQRPTLRQATFELSWLLGRGYAEAAALKLVGDRYSLRSRQRDAVRRSACTDDEREARSAKRTTADELRGKTVALDGFNCVIALEAALSGAPLFVGRDGAYRDLSSVHGSYRKVEETLRAVELATDLMVKAGVATASWLLDRPVSNSGRLKQVILEVAESAELPCTAELVANPDRELIELPDVVVASGDSLVIDGCEAWIDVPAEVLRNQGRPWLVDLTSADGEFRDRDPDQVD